LKKPRFFQPWTQRNTCM